MRTTRRRGRARTLTLFGFALASVTVYIVLRSGGDTEALQLNPQSPRSASFVVDCAATGHQISPLIYGIGGSDKPWATGTTALRAGGNPASRYNWQLDAWNTGSDWFYSNVGGGHAGDAYAGFIKENRARGVKSTIVVPMLGWVAKDTNSYSFPVGAFGPQQSTSPENRDMGNGVGRDGKPIAPGSPTMTSVRWMPADLENLVRQIRMRGDRVDSYILDNEPMLWNATHRDVHPEPATYDELLEKTIAYGSAIRRADPEAVIAGPASWGWMEYHYSARDAVAGVFLRPDRRAHGDVPLLAWYMRKLREHHQRTGVRILDIIDVHFYPMGDGIKVGNYGGGTDPDTAARRIRATRSLWDPTYRDESWINDRMRVIPMIRGWIAENYPGLGISFGEWDFGGGAHMSAGLATAETLGRFGTEGITSAYHWGSPPEGDPAFWAYRAFRNFDDKGGRFLDWSVPVKGTAALASVFASRDEARTKLVAVLLNHAPLSPLATDISIQGCNASAARAFAYRGGSFGFIRTGVGFVPNDPNIRLDATPYSMVVLDLTLGPAPSPAAPASAAPASARPAPAAPTPSRP